MIFLNGRRQKTSKKYQKFNICLYSWYSSVVDQMKLIENKSNFDPCSTVQPKNKSALHVRTRIQRETHRRDTRINGCLTLPSFEFCDVARNLSSHLHCAHCHLPSPISHLPSCIAKLHTILTSPPERQASSSIP